jgi:AbrB family looped-hinge helix DNA binding protein
MKQEKHFSSKITSKGQSTIPHAIRDILGLKDGDKVTYILKEDRVEVVNFDTIIKQKVRDLYAERGESIDEGSLESIYNVVKQIKNGD